MYNDTLPLPCLRPTSSGTIRIIHLSIRRAVNREEVRLLRHWFQRAKISLRLRQSQESSRTAGSTELEIGEDIVLVHGARDCLVFRASIEAMCASEATQDTSDLKDHVKHRYSGQQTISEVLFAKFDGNRKTQQVLKAAFTIKISSVCVGGARGTPPSTGVRGTHWLTNWIWKGKSRRSLADGWSNPLSCFSDFLNLFGSGVVDRYSDRTATTPSRFLVVVPLRDPSGCIHAIHWCLVVSVSASVDRSW